MASKKKKKYSPANDIFTHVGVILVIVLVNFILSYFFQRYDFTEDKRYSLSDKTIELLQDEDKIGERIFFRIYLDGDLPADLRKVRNSIREMLDEFRVYTGDLIQYEFIDPNGTDDEDFNLDMQRRIQEIGLRAIVIDFAKATERKKQILWPGAVIEYGANTVETVQFMKQDVITDEMQLRYLAKATISQLEYMLVSSIRKVIDNSKKTISFLHGHGELRPVETLDLRNDLGEYYMVNDIAIDGQLNALNNTDALIIAKPKRRFTEKDKFVIDQYIMRGGKVLWFIDPLNIPMDSLRQTGQTFGMSANLNIEKDMLYKYGVRLNSDVIIDEKCGPLPVEVIQQIVDWPFYPLLENKEHPITAADPVRSEYPGTIDIVNESDTAVKKTVLLTSTSNSRIFKAPARINYGIIQRPPKFNDPNMGNYPVAVLLEGRFTSAFANRPISEAFLNSPDYETKMSGEETKMLVVADGDILKNEFMDSIYQDPGYWEYFPVPLNNDKWRIGKSDGTPKFVYSNSTFVLNSIDYLLGDETLIDIRKKTITLRHLNEKKIAEDKELWRFVNIAIPLIALLILAVVQLVIRKRKYTATV